MTDISDRKYIIQQEETKFDAAVSESVYTRVGAVTNFLANREVTQADFNLNGKYNIVPTPHIAADGFITYPFDFEIISVMFFTGDEVGSSGTTEVDLTWRPETGGAFQSIFSTTPKITGSAAALRYVRNGGPSVSGMVNPVLSKTTFNAYDYIKLDVLQTRSGSVEGLFVKIFVRPRDPA